VLIEDLKHQINHISGFWEVDCNDSVLSDQQIHHTFNTDGGIFAGVFRNAMASFGIMSLASDWSLETIKKWCEENEGNYFCAFLKLTEIYAGDASMFNAEKVDLQTKLPLASLEKNKDVVYYKSSKITAGVSFVFSIDMSTETSIQLVESLYLVTNLYFRPFLI
jgi:hypothetical protein